MEKTTKKWMSAKGNLPIKITLSIACVACSFEHIGFYYDCPFINHIAYSVFHVNVFHLLINLMVLWNIRNRIDVLFSFLIAVAASFLPMFVEDPTMGLSGFLFSAFGIMWGHTGRLNEAAKKVMPFIIFTMLLPNINGLLHLYCFWIGFCVGFLSARIRATVHHG